jgi:hypothetical protein
MYTAAGHQAPRVQGEVGFICLSDVVFDLCGLIWKQIAGMCLHCATCTRLLGIKHPGFKVRWGSVGLVI